MAGTRSAASKSRVRLAIRTCRADGRPSRRSEQPLTAPPQPPRQPPTQYRRQRHRPHRPHFDLREANTLKELACRPIAQHADVAENAAKPRSIRRHRGQSDRDLFPPWRPSGSPRYQPQVCGNGHGVNPSGMAKRLRELIRFSRANATHPPGLSTRWSSSTNSRVLCRCSITCSECMTSKSHLASRAGTAAAGGARRHSNARGVDEST